MVIGSMAEGALLLALQGVLEGLLYEEADVREAGDDIASDDL
jgi:hypothetical protein